jgi:hypothetical protein
MGAQIHIASTRAIQMRIPISRWNTANALQEQGLSALIIDCHRATLGSYLSVRNWSAICLTIFLSCTGLSLLCRTRQDRTDTVDETDATRMK